MFEMVGCYARGIKNLYLHDRWLTRILFCRYGHEGVDDNVEFDEDRDGSSDDKDIDVDEI